MGALSAAGCSWHTGALSTNLRLRELATRAGMGAVVGAAVTWRSWDASDLADRRWAAVATVAVMVAVALAVPTMTARLHWSLVPVVIGAVQFAIYCCVPETGQTGMTTAAIAIVGAVAVSVRRPPAWWAVVALVGLVLWSGVFGATGRESALVGALFAIWPIVLVAVVPRADVVTASIGAIAIVAVARTGALQATISPALVAVAVAAPASLVLALATSQLRRAHPIDGRP